MGADKVIIKYKEALKWFEEDLEAGKCSADCPQCNANEVAVNAIKFVLVNIDKYSDEVVKNYTEYPLMDDKLKEVN